MTGPTKADAGGQPGAVGTPLQKRDQYSTVKQRRETLARRVKALIVRTAAAGWIPAGLASVLLGVLGLREA